LTNPASPAPRAGSARRSWPRRIRQLHRLAGLFFAPTILFFAGTGAIQTLRLHEGGPGRVPIWLADATSLHKHQRLWAPKPRMAPLAPAAADLAPPPREHPALRLFFVLAALVLAGSVISGCAMAFHAKATRRSAAMTFMLGTLVPLILYGV
jgi:hypothetical protein